MKNLLKPGIKFTIPLLVFLLLTAIYFLPIFQGKDINQMDNNHAIGMAKELNDYKDKTGDESMWTNSMFSGMPAYQIKGGTPNNVFHYISVFLRFGLPSNSMAIVFLYFFGFFILLYSLKLDTWLCFAGAAAFALSSYNFIIIEAGHLTKAYAIAYMAPVIAGVILTYSGKFKIGAVITTLALGIEIAVNHVQMTYYLMLIVLTMLVVYFIYAFKQKETNKFFKATAVLIASGIMAVIPNITNLWTTYEYSKESIRGATELTQAKDAEKHGGLDKSYALDWSYGKAETFTVLIPGFVGGASHGELGENSNTYKIASEKYGEENALQIAKSLPTYWGEMPFTSGPVYFGAIICFLFVLGLFIVKGPEKWWLLAATVLSILLSWGKNLMWFTDIFFYYFPMYNKFRSVSSILVIAGFTAPLLAFLAAKEIFNNKLNKKELLKYLKYSLYIVGGITLFFAILPGIFFDFSSSSDKQMISQGYPDFLMNSLVSDRESMFRRDAFRSLLFIGLAFVFILLYIKEKLSSKYSIILLACIIIIDLWLIDKKYLGSDDFVPKRELQTTFEPTPADLQILKDKDPNFRVFNLTINPFNEVNTSYFHKSIGGYHGAKLRRYQDLIEKYIAKSNMNVLNMLNTKYFIISDSLRRPIAQFNPMAYGNAWFVDSILKVENADSELASLAKVDLKRTAVIDKRFVSEIKETIFNKDSSDFINLKSYKPNSLIYESSAKVNKIAVFSEIFYDKGWNAYLDGKLVPHIRANYVLRAMNVPAGKHTIEFKFEPKSFYLGQKIALISSILISIICLSLLFIEYKSTLKPAIPEQKNKEL